MKRWIRLLGSIKIAVPLLITIAAVLAWGTIYETLYGTATVQRFIYSAWWFQAILAFLAINLAIAALQRYPWKKHHIPFVLAHIGIILILIGGMIGSRFGIEGQLIIAEGQSERVMEAPGNILAVSQADSLIAQIIPTQFETKAWVREPNLKIPLQLEGRNVELTVDRYFPNAISDETITDGGVDENPAIRVLLQHEAYQDSVWLMSQDPETFGVAWLEAHVLFLEPNSKKQLKHLIEGSEETPNPQGVIFIQLPGSDKTHEIPVPEDFGDDLKIKGTPYRILFKDYFADFAITQEGPVSRSSDPNNPAISFTLNGPEGTDAYLLFALHPEFQSMHGFEHIIGADVQFMHGSSGGLPPDCIALIRDQKGALLAVTTGAESERKLFDSLEVGKWYTHPQLGYEFQVAEYYSHAKKTYDFRNRGNEVKAEAIHVIAREGDDEAASWIWLRDSAELAVGDKPVLVEYRPVHYELPFSVKLSDFRKISYPGIDMAEEFESDIQLTDMDRGIILMRKISMNNPFRYRGYSLFQSSFIPGSPEVTILSVRNDPGTPVVYTGFITVIAGVMSLFILRTPAYKSRKNKKKRKRS